MVGAAVVEKTTWDQFRTNDDVIVVGSAMKESPSADLHAHAATFQKVYNAFRTRRNLGDCRLIVEDIWLVLIVY